jgi:hypothetical protein
MVIRNNFKAMPDIEFALSGSSLLLMLLMSTSQFKLPHYLNILFPLFSIIAAKAILRFVEERNSLPQWIKITLYVIGGLYVLLGLVLNAWAFPIQSSLLIIFALITAVIATVIISRFPIYPLRPVFITLIIVGVINLFLNINFFPRVLSYQGSSTLADYVNRNNIPREHINSFTSRRYFAFDFYIQKDTPEPSLPEIKQRSAANEKFYMITDKGKLKELTSAGIPVDIITVVPHFHVSKISGKFINPLTRQSSLDSMILLRVN